MNSDPGQAQPLDDASAWRIALARELAPRYASHPDVSMIVLGGSPSRGLADAHSDLDVVVYWKAVDRDFIEAFPLEGTGGRRLGVRPMGEDGACLEHCYFDTVKVDFGHLPMTTWETLVGEVLDGFDATPSKLQGLGGFLDSIVLHGEEEAARWKARIAPYPDGLVEAVVRRNLGFFVKGCLVHQGLERGDLLFFVDGQCRVIRQLLAIVAAINRRYFSPEDPRWIRPMLEGMAHRPRDVWERILAVLDGDRNRSDDVLEGLVDDVLDLVDAHVPGVSTERIRKGREDLAVKACARKPLVEEAS